jgi:hypothetical protein
MHRPSAPCEALAKASVVAVVDVIDANDPYADSSPRTGSGYPMQTARLRVLEAFKGLSTEQRDVVAKVDVNAESVLFETGTRFLVYTHENENGHRNTACSRRRRVGEDDEEVKHYNSVGNDIARCD